MATYNGRFDRRNKVLRASYNMCGILFFVIFFFEHVLCGMEFSSHWSKCSESDYYLAIRNLSLEQCMTECFIRSQCQGANYKTVRRICELFSAGGVGSLAPTKACVFIDKKSVDQTPEACTSPSCQVCNQQEGTCSVRECARLFDTETTTVSGNLQSVNRLAVIHCKPGFIYTDGSYRSTHSCNSSGNWTPQRAECIQVNCAMVAKGTKKSGEYETFDEGSQKVVKIYCDYFGDHGYTYVSKASFIDVTDLTRHYTSMDHVNVRHLRSDASRTQMEGNISVLTRYRPGTLSILLNKHNYGFAAPRDISSKYIYLQLIPDNFIFKPESIVGYNFEDYDVTQTTCDADQNDYLVLHTGQDDLGWQEKCSGKMIHIGCVWIESASIVDAESHLPSDYFYRYSLHIGGCGILLHSVVATTGDKIEGVALGLRFDL